MADRQKKTLVVGQLLLLSGTLSITAQGYPTPVDFDGTLLRWNIAPESGPITYEIKGEDPNLVEYFRPTVAEAARLWSTVDGSYVKLEEADSGGTAKITIELNNTIDGEDYSSGYSVFDESSDAGPVHCNVTILASLQEYSVGKTILHELGHCVGLGHSLIPEAIMSYNLEANGFELDVDDRAAVARLYPLDGREPQLPPGCAVGSATTGTSFPGVLTLLGLPFLIVRMIRVRERASTRT